MATHSSTFAWKNPMDGGAWWAIVLGVAKSWTWLSNLTFTFHFHALEKEMATHSSVLAWRIPGMVEPGGLPSMGSQSQTRLKWLSSSSSRIRYFPSPRSVRLWTIPGRLDWLSVSPEGRPFENHMLGCISDGSFPSAPVRTTLSLPYLAWEPGRSPGGKTDRSLGWPLTPMTGPLGDLNFQACPHGASSSSATVPVSCPGAGSYGFPLWEVMMLCIHLSLSPIWG